MDPTTSITNSNLNQTWEKRRRHNLSIGDPKLAANNANTRSGTANNYSKNVIPTNLRNGNDGKRPGKNPRGGKGERRTATKRGNEERMRCCCFHFSLSFCNLHFSSSIDPLFVAGSIIHVRRTRGPIPGLIALSGMSPAP